MYFLITPKELKLGVLYVTGLPSISLLKIFTEYYLA